MNKRLLIIGLYVILMVLSQAASGQNPDTLRKQASALLQEYKNDTAIVLYELILHQAEEKYGPNDTMLIGILHSLGHAYMYEYNISKTLQHYNRAMKIIQENFGLDDIRMAAFLKNLGGWLRVCCRFDQAEKYLNRDLQISLAFYDSNHISLVTTYRQLGVLFYRKGEYGKAMEYLEKARDIHIGNSRFDANLGYIMNNMGNIYLAQGKYEDAEAAYVQAFELRLKSEDFTNPHLGEPLNSLGNLHAILGEYSESIRYYNWALYFRERILGPEHESLVYSLNGLGHVYVELGLYEKADTAFQRALHISQSTFGPEHLMVARTCANLGDLYMSQGEYVEAERHYLSALDINNNLMGENHYTAVKSLESICRLCRLQNNAVKAMEYAEHSCNIRQRHFEENARILSEEEALIFSQFLRIAADNYISCYFELDSGIGNTRDVAEVILSCKGQVSDEIFDRQKALVKETDSITLALVDSLNSAKDKLSYFYVRKLGNDYDMEAYSYVSDSLNEYIERLEADLSNRSASFKSYRDRKNVSVDRIGSCLPGKSILVEFYKYNRNQANPDSSTAAYLAVIIADREKPVVINLGNSSDIDSLVSGYRKHMLFMSGERAMANDLDQWKYDRINKALYERIWRPIEDFTGDRDLVLISPDGALNMISFAGLKDNAGKYPIEKYAIHYLSSGRDIIRFGNETEVGNGLFALGDPDYDASVSERLALSSRPKDVYATADHGLTSNIRSASEGFKNIAVYPLPWTKVEIENIVKIWKAFSDEPVIRCLGLKASEDRFKRESPGNRIIHLATHGYFLQDIHQEDLPVGEYNLDNLYVGEHPLLRSGLFFSGGNLHGEGADSAGIEDGILTAYEVSAMDFTGAELVVLSACETALGEVKCGEGVYGLRRAFQMAGARTVISALWPVSDKRTSEMMKKLYSREGRTLPEQIRKLQLDMIQDLRAHGENDHPFNWGAFIAQGAWE
jgi:CHAT domain-containing protein/Tfp pilus assembly protein PilF